MFQNPQDKLNGQETRGPITYRRVVNYACSGSLAASEIWFMTRRDYQQGRWFHFPRLLAWSFSGHCHTNLALSLKSIQESEMSLIIYVLLGIMELPLELMCFLGCSVKRITCSCNDCFCRVKNSKRMRLGVFIIV